ncbi:MAG: lipid-A-disaccharide synthase [Candidatus Sumerlaeaceae bacterium]
MAGPSSQPLKLMFVAGEHSADQHASRLISILKRQVSDLECFGYGGKAMESAGMRLEFDLASGFPIIGITQALYHYPQLKQLFRQACALLESKRPDALVLVDYPGFNLRLAQQAARLGIPVIYYIAPQVWAWHYSRIEILKRAVSLLLVIFPFEETLFREAGIETYFVGHPLLDAPSPTRTKAQVCQWLGFKPDATLIGLLPGSRRSEWEYHLRPLLDAAGTIAKHIPSAAFVIPKAHTVDDTIVAQAMRARRHFPIAVALEDHASVRGALDFAICKSGTSTLELALAGVPQIVIYRVSWLTYLFARTVVRTPWISLVNIVAGREVVPELLQHEVVGPKIAAKALDILLSPQRLAAMRSEYERIRQSFGKPGSAARAVERIIEFLDKRRVKPAVISP